MTQATQATRSNLLSVDSTLSAAITASQDYIPVASTTGFSTSVVAEVETTNEVVSFSDISSNLLLQSQTLNVSPWSVSNVTITADSTTAPDGTTTADTMQMTASGQLLQDSLSAAANTTFTWSCHVKQQTAGFLRVLCFNAAQNSYIGGWFNTDTGAWATTAALNGTLSASTAEDAGDGWYRISLSGQVTTDVTKVWHYLTASDATTARSATPVIYLWGEQLEMAAAATTYLPTTSAALVGLTGVTRGVNGTTAATASSGDDIQQLPYALNEVNMPVRLTGLSVSSDGTGAGRLTLCDKVGTHLCDIDINEDEKFTLDFGGGIIFPNGIYVANSDNITAYTLFTDIYNTPNLTAGG